MRSARAMQFSRTDHLHVVLGIGLIVLTSQDASGLLPQPPRPFNSIISEPEMARARIVINTHRRT
jgi:hypothetical protein